MIWQESKNILKTSIKIRFSSYWRNFGKELLAQTGQRYYKGLPLGSTSVKFNTEFEETGINQTKYKVYLEVDTNARNGTFRVNEIDVHTTLLISETVI